MKSATSDSLTVEWAPPIEINGVIRNYSVICAPSDGSEATTMIVGNVLEAEVRGLLSCQNYTVTVTATTGGGEGPESDELVGKTHEGKLFFCFNLPLCLPFTTFTYDSSLSCCD